MNGGVVQSIAKLLRLNVPMAMKLAFDSFRSSTFKTGDEAISDFGGYDSIEFSVMLCNDEFIRKLNEEWRDEDHATDVLSMSLHVLGLDLPIAEERGHNLIDEIRVLLVERKQSNSINQSSAISFAMWMGLIVYGGQGREIFRSNLGLSVCIEACLYSWKNKVPLIAFINDRCLTLFEHPLVDSLHTVYHEPKAEIMLSFEHLLSAADM
ncbi:hypothetical protein Peur_009106 [Populus x canadensis]